MLRNTYLCGNKMFTNKVNAASFGKVGPSGPEKLELI